MEATPRGQKQGRTSELVGSDDAGGTERESVDRGAGGTTLMVPVTLREVVEGAATTAAALVHHVRLYAGPQRVLIPFGRPRDSPERRPAPFATIRFFDHRRLSFRPPVCLPTLPEEPSHLLLFRRKGILEVPLLLLRSFELGEAFLFGR